MGDTYDIGNCNTIGHVAPRAINSQFIQTSTTGAINKSDDRQPYIAGNYIPPRNVNQQQPEGTAN